MPTQKTTATIEPEIVPETEQPQVQEPLDSLAKRDEFATLEYIDPNAPLPRLQALRGMTLDLCGYFIAADQMAKAGWLDFDSVVDQLVSYTFESSGEQEQGLLLKSPRMLVCPRTPLMAFDRAASVETEKLVILGHWQREYKEDDNVGNCQGYEVILLDSQNRPLHSVPLSYVAKGANQGSFSVEWQKLVDEVTTCHAIANGIPARPKNAKFKSLCVFAFTVGRELVGKKQKSFACRVTSHEVPTLENWKDYFVGFNQSLKQQAWEGLQPELPLIVPGEAKPLPALPGTVNE